MHPKDLSIADYTYELPPDRIALYPLPDRDASKLLVYRSEAPIIEDTYRHLDRHLPDGALLIFNNTRVVEARIVFQKPSGGQIEIFCLEPASGNGDIAAAFGQTATVRWRCLIGGASKWKHGQVLRRDIPDGAVPLVLEARFIGKEEGAFLIDLSWSPATLSFAEVLHIAGLIPLPPYIHREAGSADAERYQTVYARHEGSVAAPTAGLHFTGAVFERLRARSIDCRFVTLHVGAGTFMPVKSERLGGHLMHAEFIDVDRATIQTLIGRHRDPVIPVGTTSVRTIESLYWLGVKTIRDPHLPPEELVVHQWDPYERHQNRPVEESLTALMTWMENTGHDRLVTKTQLLITPGYRWRLAKGLITNFHQPHSTLLLLVAALIGEDWRKVYAYALSHDFRFLSYGDGCLLLP